MEVRETVNKLTEACIELRTRLDKCDKPNERAALVLNHLEKFAQTGVRIADFQAGLEWLNVSESLSLNRHLNKKLIILDFFTYCCINCMHVLPDLFELEKKFSIEDGLVVIGVHSAKFANEREQNRLSSAVQRYGINHPVANDKSLSCWRASGIMCWPTLLMIGPAAQPLAVFVGEGHKEELFLYTELALKYFRSRNSISDHRLPLLPSQKLTAAAVATSRGGSSGSGILRFPGKLAVSCLAGDTETLVLSDSGNNRILLVDSRGGLLKDVVGGSEAAFKDGGFADARFSAPQGICTLADKIYIADTENHAIRMIDLQERTVISVAGTGSQGHDYIGGKIGRDQAVSSPWDVCIYHEENIPGELLPVLLIAMAGTHQIWALFLEDTVWWKNKKFKAGTCVAVVGSGKEENRNNAYPHAAGLAQPSGLVVDQEGKALFFADSESSAIRRVDLQSGRVTAVCGGNKNPANLHDYGDVDGTGNAAKLQHPLGLAWSAAQQILYIADTYNHKLKTVRLNGTCQTFCGRGKPDGTFLFDEPSGLAINRNSTLLYVADTNNHAVRVVHLSDKTISTLSIELPSEKSPLPAEPHSDQTYQFDTVISTNGGELVVTFSLRFEGELKLNKESRQQWRVPSPLPATIGRIGATTGDLSAPIMLVLPPGSGTHELRILLDIVACSATKCIPKLLCLLYRVHQTLGAPSTVVERRELIVKE